TTIGIDDDRNAAVGGTHNRQPLLDRADAGNQKMLHRPSIGAEPRIVRHVNQPSRTRLTSNGLGENYLVTNERPNGRRSGYGESPWPFAGRESGIGGNFGQSDRPE